MTGWLEQANHSVIEEPVFSKFLWTGFELPAPGQWHDSRKHWSEIFLTAEYGSIKIEVFF